MSQGNSSGGGQELGRRDARHLTLEPHVPSGNNTHRFGNGVAIGAIGGKALIPERLLQMVAVPVGAFEAQFAQQNQGTCGCVEMVFNQRAATRLVAYQAGTDHLMQVWNYLL